MLARRARLPDGRAGALLRPASYGRRHCCSTCGTDAPYGPPTPRWPNGIHGAKWSPTLRCRSPWGTGCACSSWCMGAQRDLSELTRVLCCSTAAVAQDDAAARPAVPLLMGRRLRAGLTAYTAQSGPPHCDAVPLGAPGAPVPVDALGSQRVLSADGRTCYVWARRTGWAAAVRAARDVAGDAVGHQGQRCRCSTCVAAVPCPPPSRWPNGIHGAKWFPTLRCRSLWGAGCVCSSCRIAHGVLSRS